MNDERPPQSKTATQKAAEAAANMGPLQLATTDELLDEIGRRFRAALFIGEKGTPGEEEETTTFTRYAGSLNTAIGLAARAKCNLLFDARDVRIEDDLDNGR